MRQFRRYIASGDVPGVRPGKRGHYYVTGPVTPGKLRKIRRRIEDKQHSQRQRGGESRHRAKRGHKPAQEAPLMTMDEIEQQFQRLIKRTELKRMSSLQIEDMLLSLKAFEAAAAAGRKEIEIKNACEKMKIKRYQYENMKEDGHPRLRQFEKTKDLPQREFIS